MTIKHSGQCADVRDPDHSGHHNGKYKSPEGELLLSSRTGKMLNMYECLTCHQQETYKLRPKINLSEKTNM